MHQLDVCSYLFNVDDIRNSLYDYWFAQLVIGNGVQYPNAHILRLIAHIFSLLHSFPQCAICPSHFQIMVEGRARKLTRTKSRRTR